MLKIKRHRRKVSQNTPRKNGLEGNGMKMSQRYYWLDYCRSLAILFVIVVHTTESVYFFNQVSFENYSLSRHVLMFTLFTLGRLGVPLFLFITGYLLLDRQYDYTYSQKFYKKNLKGLLVTSGIWIIFYNLFNKYFHQMPFDITALTRNIIYLEPTNMSHMWYIPVIIGIYICLPLISNGLATTDQRILKYPLSIACIYLFIVPELNVLLRSFQVDTISSLIDFSFIGGVYGIYLIIGYLVKQGSFIRVNKLWWMTIGGISFIFTVFIQIYSYKANVGYNVWYNNATLAITALSLFMLLSQIKFSQSKIIENISKCSFGIFIMHNPIKMILMRYVDYCQLNVPALPSFVPPFAIKCTSYCQPVYHLVTSV